MPSDAIDLLFDWQVEREADREPASRTESRTTITPRKPGYKVKPWPSREATAEELASGPSRTCVQCGVTYPETKEFFKYHPPTRTWRQGGFLPRCRGCHRKVVRDNKRRARHTFAQRCRTMRFGARKREIEWGFDHPEDPRLRDLYDAPCHYCGGDVSNRIALDRVDSTKGYVPGNVVQCCPTCNMMKMRLSVDEWVAHMERVLNHLRSPLEGSVAAEDPDDGHERH